MGLGISKKRWNPSCANSLGSLVLFPFGKGRNWVSKRLSVIHLRVAKWVTYFLPDWRWVVELPPPDKSHRVVGDRNKIVWGPTCSKGCPLSPPPSTAVVRRTFPASPHLTPSGCWLGTVPWMTPSPPSTDSRKHLGAEDTAKEIRGVHGRRT